MGYAEFKPVVKKVNLKPKGEVEIVLTTSLDGVRGKIEAISDMIDQKVHVALESEVVTYNVQIDAKTDRPLLQYKIDDRGVVSEIKPTGEQLEMGLEMPKEKPQIREELQEIDRQIVDEFIMSGLAPRDENYWYPIAEWIERLTDGETYLKLASEAGISSGKIVDIIDDYRRSVAPLAAKWDEWRQAKAEAGDGATDPKSEDPNTAEASQEADQTDVGCERDDTGTEDDIELKDNAGSEHEQTSKDVLSDWERAIMEGEEAERTAEPVDIESIILMEKPQFDDIQFDFPALLERRKAGETWMEIASSLGIPSTRLSSAWSKYKKRVQDMMKGPGAA